MQITKIFQFCNQIKPVLRYAVEFHKNIRL
nr:MAG TPA_asm: hypothetical protein [Bacteriophage sp.]